MILNNTLLLLMFIFNAFKNKIKVVKIVKKQVFTLLKPRSQIIFKSINRSFILLNLIRPSLNSVILSLHGQRLILEILLKSLQLLPQLLNILINILLRRLNNNSGLFNISIKIFNPFELVSMFVRLITKVL